MNVAIIDSYHFEVTYTLISLFDKDDNKITIFVHHPAYQQLLFMLAGKETRYTWIVKNENKSNREFIAQLFLYLRKHQFELLYFNTIEDNFILYAFNIRHFKNIKKVLTLHDVNGFFHYRPSLSIRRLVRYIGKKRLLKIFPNFNVLSETLKVNLQSKLKAVKKIYAIPGSYFSPQLFAHPPFKNGDTWEIAITGAVDTRRRNYEKVFEFLDIAQQQNINVSLTLLGGFSKGNSEWILQQCQNYLQKNNNLYIYQSPIVDQPEFDRILNKTHFIWMPLQTNVIISDGVQEQYGVSTCSGNIADAIRYAKPFFAPKEIPVDTLLDNSCIKYISIADLINKIKELNEFNFAVLQQQAYKTSLHYTLDKIICRNEDLFKT